MPNAAHTNGAFQIFRFVIWPQPGSINDRLMALLGLYLTVLLSFNSIVEDSETRTPEPDIIAESPCA